MKRKLFWIIPSSIVVLTIVGFAIALSLARVTIKQERTYLYIYPEMDYNQVKDSLKTKDVIHGTLLFDVISKGLGYDEIKSGRYEIQKHMSLFKLVNKLSKGQQAPLRLIIGKSRLKEEFAAKISDNLMFSKEELISLLNDSIFLSQYSYSPQTSLSMIIPNTYELYWDISPKNFIERMNKESDKFWQKRKEILSSCGLSKLEIMTLASIVEEETNKNDEKRRIAGVYLNRINKGMLLQADPSVKYAVGDFTINRIGGAMLKTDSPYNTYRYKGLPPSPICIPSIASIDAALNYERHNYIFFCAKEDFSGYHNFAVNAKEHLANARAFQKALNQRGIKLK